jgi:transposase
MTIPGVGPFIASALTASVGDPKYFSSGSLGGISKRGDGYLRKLLIHGARAVVYRARRKQTPGAWIAGVLMRRPFNVAAVALANKTARIAWAILVGGETYRAAA